MIPIIWVLNCKDLQIIRRQEVHLRRITLFSLSLSRLQHTPRNFKAMHSANTQHQ